LQEQEWREKRLVFGRLVTVTRKDKWGNPSVEVEVREKAEEGYGYEWEKHYYCVAPDIDLAYLSDKLGRDVQLEVIDGTVRRVLSVG